MNQPTGYQIRKANLEDTGTLAEFIRMEAQEAEGRDLDPLVVEHGVQAALEGAVLDYWMVIDGLGNAISDGHLVVYFPHLVVRPDYQGRGIGTELMIRIMARYRDFHQQTLLADGLAIDFYKKLGFVRSGSTEPLWIYDGHEHD